MDNIIVNHVGEDVAVWVTGDVTATRATGDVATKSIAIIYVTVTGIERYIKTAADGTVECSKVIIRLKYIDMVRRDTICAKRARVRADTPD
jgi:hypothetical protein